MARKTLQVKKETKRLPLRKKLQKIKDKKIEIILLQRTFGNHRFHVSDTLVTDNNKIILFLDNPNEFIKDQKLDIYDDSGFNWEDIDLQLEYNRKEQIEFDEFTDDGKDEPVVYMNHDIGYVNYDLYNWFKQTFPSCVFHHITKWFGKRVNTLVIVLAEEYGKPVAIVKIHEDYHQF